MITVIIPFFDKDFYRKRNVEAVIDNFFTNYPQFEIIIAEQKGESVFIRDVLVPKYPLLKHIQYELSTSRFNKSYIVNQTVKYHASYDIIMMSDADCILPMIDINDILTELTEHSVFFPFSHVNFLNEAHTRRYITGKPLKQVIYKQDLFISRYTGLINVFTLATFNGVGGFDEEFEGWGGEDDAFIDKCVRLISPIKRSTNNVELLHLYHPKVNTDEYNKSECFTWNKKRAATIRRMSDEELRSYVVNVNNGVIKPLEPIVKLYDEAGKLEFDVKLRIGSGFINIDTSIYAISSDHEINLKEILWAIVNTDGTGFLKTIIDLIDERIKDMSADEILIVDYFRSMCF